jgi:hypothetical protein
MTAIPVKGNERDHLARARTYDTVWFAAGFVAAFGAFTVKTNHLLPDSADGLLTGVELGAAVIWGWAFARMVIHQRRARAQPALQASLNDEFYKKVRLLTARASFKAIIAAQAIMGFAGLLWPSLQRVSPALPIEVTLLVAWGAMGVATLIYDRE